MKSRFALTLLLATALTQAHAQMRRLRPDEAAFYTTLHKTMYAAIPHTYKDWKVTNDDQPDFDINNYWCQNRQAPDAGCKGMTLASVGKGDPYSLVSMVEFAMPEEQSSAAAVNAMKAIKDYTNAGQIAIAMKAAASSKLSIQIVGNLDGGDAEVTYCSKTPPTTLSLPVPATLALKGVRSAQCPIMAEGQPDLHGNYYDVAVIYLGKPVASKTPDSRSDGTSGMRYKIGFDHSKIGMPVLQNIAVTIKGDSADIDAAVALIDWKSLYALIAK